MSEDTLSEFGEELARLASRHAVRGRHNPDELADMIERLSSALGFTVAMAAQGDPEAIDRLMVGAEAHAHAEAVDKAPLVKLASLFRSPG